MRHQKWSPPPRSEAEGTAGLPPRKETSSAESIATTHASDNTHPGWEPVLRDGRPYTDRGHVVYYHPSRSIYAIERDGEILRPLDPIEQAILARYLPIDAGDCVLEDEDFADRCAAERGRRDEQANPSLTELW